MAAQAVQNAPSGRFIRAYLLTWGLLAAGGLTYVASLAWQPQLFAPSQPQTTEPDRGIQAANKALAEVGTVRGVVIEMQRDLGRLRATVDQREAEERAAQARLAALEERVTTIAPPALPAAQPAASPPASKQRTTAERRQKAAEPARTSTRIISVPEALKEEPAPVTKAEIETPKIETPKIETGSIVAQPTITFGEPEVTPARQAFAVQLAAGPSLESLRLSWSMLRDRHGGALASLQPRFVPPRAEGGPYRLLAGPLPSKADADKVCADLGVGRQGCFSTGYVGEPL